MTPLKEAFFGTGKKKLFYTAPLRCKVATTPTTLLQKTKNMTVSNMTESRLQADCYTDFHNSYPDQRGQLFMIYNNPKNAAHGAVLKAMGMVAGCSDLIYLTASGRILFLECKLPEGVQSPAQKKFEDMVTRLGHQYKIFKSLEQFREIIRFAQ